MCPLQGQRAPLYQPVFFLDFEHPALSGRSRHCPKRFRDISGLVILIGEAFAACRRVDDATIAEAGFEDEVAHEVVVAMRVDAKRVVAVHGIAQDELHDAVCLAVARHAMDGGVGGGGGPGTVVDDDIRGVVARAKHEGGNDLSATLNDVAGAGGDVGKEDVVAGITVDPLGGVAALRHEAAGTGEELLEGGEVGGTRGAHEVLAAEGDAVALGSEGMGGDVGHGGKGFFGRGGDYNDVCGASIVAHFARKVRGRFFGRPSRAEGPASCTAAPERGSYSRIGACPYLPPVLIISRCCPCKGRISLAGLAPQ